MTLHAELLTELRRRIVGGVYDVGAALPSEAALRSEFGVSRGTVRQALGALRGEGLIGGGQGRPPVVRSRAVPQSFATFLSFSRWARELGREPGQRTVEVARRVASSTVADALGIDEGDAVVEVLRLRLLDGAPALIERSAFVADVGLRIFEFDPDEGSIYDHLTARGVELVDATHVIDAVAADDVDAGLLGVPAGTPLLRERRTARDQDGRVVESSDDRYLPAQVTFTVENRRDGARPRVGMAPTLSA